MKYILIIWLSSSSLATAEFDSRNACERALQVLLARPVGIEGLCVPKGLIQQEGYLLQQEE